MFVVLHNGYTSESQTNTYTMCNKHTIEWSAQHVKVNFPSGTSTMKRPVEHMCQMFCIHKSSSQTTVWDNTDLIFINQHNTSKDKFLWHTNSMIDILPNTDMSQSSGFCEMLLFDHAVDLNNLNMVHRYLCDKYHIMFNNIDHRVFRKR